MVDVEEGGGCQPAAFVAGGGWTPLAPSPPPGGVVKKGHGLPLWSLWVLLYSAAASPLYQLV